MPMKPQAPESVAPSANANAVVVPSAGIKAMDEEDGADCCDGAVLTGQVGGCTLLDRVCNFLHPGIAGG